MSLASTTSDQPVRPPVRASRAWAAQSPTSLLAPFSIDRRECLPDDVAIDFRVPSRIGARLFEPNDQLGGRGYDQNWILRRGAPGLAPAARLADLTSGRILEISTTEPGIQWTFTTV